MYDLNDAEPQRGSVMDPCFAKVIGMIRPGGVDGQAPCDQGLLAASKQAGSDVLLLDFEFTVAEGRNTGRKFWKKMPVCGGEVDQKGVSKGWNITKSTLRAMIDSALGLNPKDESETARQKRVLNGFAQLNGIPFVAKIGVKKDESKKYPDQNTLDHVVTPDEREWQLVMSGQDVPIISTGSATSQQPSWGPSAWGQPAAASQAAPAQPQRPAPVPAASQQAWGQPNQSTAPQPPAHPGPAPGFGWPAGPQQGARAPAAPAAPPPPATAPAPMAGPAWLNG